MTVLLTTHYMEEADALCDRVALMHHGRLQTVGAPDELQARASDRRPPWKRSSATTPDRTWAPTTRHNRDCANRSSRRAARRVG